MEQQQILTTKLILWLTYRNHKAVACYVDESQCRSSMLYYQLSMARLNSDDYRVHSSKKVLDQNIVAIEILAPQWMHQIVPLSTG